jgi:hypothetical protein
MLTMAKLIKGKMKTLYKILLSIFGVAIALLLISLLPIHDCGYQLAYYHCSAWG